MSQIQKHYYGSTRSAASDGDTASTSSSLMDESHDLSSLASPPPSFYYTLFMAVCYVFSGVTQPLIMTLAKEAGIADPSCQLYMVAYYLGPALVTLSGPSWPKSTSSTAKTAGIAFFDLFAQALNYTGSMYAGPTIFAIIYSSVTVWTAVFSRLLLRKKKSLGQWIGVGVVFLGLCITGLNSVHLGPKVFHGAVMVLVGSCLHALVYVFSEAVMKCGDDKVTVQANCAIQGIVASSSLILWQFVYTRSRWDELIHDPVQASGSTWFHVGMILVVLAVSNLIHAFCYFHTLANFPGGATSAGVMKGLQAVLIFVFTSLAYCGKLGGQEMCFSRLKLISLVVVVLGVVIFGKATSATTEAEKQQQKKIIMTKAACSSDPTTTPRTKDGYWVVGGSGDCDSGERQTFLQAQEDDSEEVV